MTTTATATPTAATSSRPTTPTFDSLPQRRNRRRRGDRHTRQQVEQSEDVGGDEKQERVLVERPIRDIQYEYLDHTADIQLHAWGDTLAHAFENIILAMFGYMTSDYTTVEMDASCTIDISVSGHDMDSLLYKWMDEFLYRFATDEIICKDVEICHMDIHKYQITAKGYGERFSLQKHPAGTEIKAITYSNMQIRQQQGRVDLYVIVDI